MVVHQHEPTGIVRIPDHRKRMIHFGIICALLVVAGAEGASLLDWSFLGLAVAVEII